MRDKAGRRLAAIEAAGKVKIKKLTKAQQAKVQARTDDVAERQMDDKMYRESLSGSQQRKATRIKRRTRATQDKHTSRSAFRGRWRDRYNMGTAAAMRAIHEGRVPKATEAMRVSVARQVASIRHDDAATAEHLFGPVQPSEGAFARD